ncbi:SDR family NAD(P)-dependent oxidoreductase [Frigoribacterium faeni]|uniref:SDR family NAD(P)-dependent oxidoreductase n=1 Tax=Frigoribacterium faeni TaxID=145483 RepID=UPI00141A6C22|nr:SDR family NAD(P)-dependent oxidoreductase [Frigoribacterium faeni]NIJ05458.1 NAD(P)-dependent dehydrogenase (short-subunit alcohol dehydrogenase family) [Frigoribacterium faeni]
MSVTLPAPGRLDDRAVVVTGASSGIGREAARALSELGATVAVVGRNPDRTRAVADEVGGTAYLADFADLSSVRSLADQLLADLPRIHVLANNAGATISERQRTSDGFELTFQGNHLAPFLLTSLLLPRMVETAADLAAGTVRVVQTSSAGNLFGHVDLDDLDGDEQRWLGGFRAYGTSKLLNILFTRELARRLGSTGVDAFAFHPGFVASGFGGDGPVMAFAKRAAVSTEQGAEPLVRLAAAPSVPAPSGNYFDRLRAPGRVAAQAGDRDLMRGLWERSADLLGIPADPLA